MAFDEDEEDVLGVLVRYPHAWIPLAEWHARCQRIARAGVADRAAGIIAGLTDAGHVVAWDLPDAETARDGRPVPAHCRGPQATLSGEAAEALAVEIAEAIDESPRWFHAERADDDPRPRCPFDLMPLPRAVVSPGIVGIVRLRFADRIAAKGEAGTDEVVVDNFTGEPVILWGGTIPIRRKGPRRRKARKAG